MAENVDFEITAGVLPDIASAKAAGAKLRAALEAEVSNFAGDILKGQKGYKAVMKTVSGLSEKTGLDAYYQIARTRRALSRVSRKGMSPQQRDDYYEALSDLLTVENVSRRLAINEPINKAMAYNRRLVGLNDALNTLGSGLGPNFKKDYLRAKRSGDTEALAGLERQLAEKQYAAAQVLGFVARNPGTDEVSDENIAAAMSVKTLYKEIQKNTQAVKTLTKVATIFSGEAIKTIAGVVPTYWQEHIDRSFWGTEKAQIARTGAVAKGVGGTLGGILGAAIGGAITGGLGGQFIGAGIGANLGETAGGLYGDYLGKQLEAVQKTISQVNERYRSFGIYRGQASVGYAQSIADTDMASVSDVNKMVHNSATLSARMMFGQVGENEMLMYSLMPGYFAAAMSGATDAELAEAYKNDVEKLPPQLRVWAAENVGGGSLGMLAYTQSPMWGAVQANAGNARYYDAMTMVAGAGYATETAIRANINRRKEFEEFGEDLWKQKPKEGIWRPTGSIYEAAVISKYAKQLDLTEGINEMAPGSFPEKRATGEPIKIINNIVVDGNVVQSEENDITQEMMRGGYTPTLTSLLGVD